MKRFFKFLTVAMLVICVACGLFACAPDQTADNEKGLKYKKNIGEDFYTVCGYVDDGQTSLEIPADVDGVAVGRIGAGAFKNNGTLTAVSVPTSVTEIEAGAFAGVKALKEITLPFIGLNANSDAFYGDTGASEGDEKVKAVDIERHFAYIFGTEEYTYGSSVQASYSADGTATYYLPHGLSKVTIKSADAYSIPMYAFAGVTTLREVVLKDGVDAIGENAFSGCTNLNKINLPATVTDIYASAFAGCTRLVDGSITFDANSTLQKIGDKAFITTNITEMVLPASVKVIGEQCFISSALKKVVLSASLEEIGFYAFYDCKNLTVVDFSAVTNTVIVKNAAFMNCKKLDASSLKASALFDVTNSANVYEGTLA